ncbi:MAG TPA: hypothetical protein PKD55_15355 [Bellilinea sp.]|nr:hypothetical protein [Bellilinea sp.]
MQQLCDKVYIEHTYPGVTVGAILGDCSLVLIDAPLRPEDGRQWKHSTSGLYSGKERLIVALNGHPDRTLGIKNLDAQVVGHERLMRVYDHRTQIFKPPPVESGSDWERFGNLGTMRWNPPDVTFSKSLTVHCGNFTVELEHHPGPTGCTIWAVLRQQKILFVGDTVTTKQPPFLSSANFPQWIASLDHILSEYADYTLVGGRHGLVTIEEVAEMRDFLDTVQTGIKGMPKVVRAEDINRLAADYLKRYNVTDEFQSLYLRRLTYGLQQCAQRATLKPGMDFDDV